MKRKKRKEKKGLIGIKFFGTVGSARGEGEGGGLVALRKSKGIEVGRFPEICATRRKERGGTRSEILVSFKL